MKFPTTPSPLHEFHVTEADIAAIAAKLVETTAASIERVITRVTMDDATFDNVLVQIAHMENDLAEYGPYFQLLQNVSPLADIRRASTAALKELETAENLIYENETLFALVEVVMKRPAQRLDEESNRLLGDVYTSFINRGLKLDKTAQARFSAIRKRKSELRKMFIENLGTNPGCVWIHEDELQGLSTTALAKFDRDEQGRRRISLRGVDAAVIAQQCSNGATRRKVFYAKENIQPGNAPLLRDAVLLRDEGARMLGYSSYMHQMVSRRMMKTPDAVTALLEDLHVRLQPLIHREIQGLRSLNADGKELYLWDSTFYRTRMLENNHVDQELIAEYFPADYVVPRMLETFETLFHLKITQITDKTEAHVWHQDVQVYSVKDLVDGSFVGYLYMDLYPRDGKFSGNANFNIRPSYANREGDYITTSTALICNITGPSVNCPALLPHSNLVTVFHELGHGMHDLLGRTRFSQLHGWGGRRDFVETPSQLLEFWCWLPDIVKNMSCHYSYLSEKSFAHWKNLHHDIAERLPKHMPDHVSRALAASKYLNEAMATGRQVAFSMFDAKIHNPSSYEELEEMDIAKEYYTILSSASGLRGPDDGVPPGNGHSTSTHFMWGQEANYYSYVSTRILAADIWKTCFSANPMDPKASLRYRQMVLDKGGSSDEAKMVAALLSREPNMDAFLEDIVACVPDRHH